MHSTKTKEPVPPLMKRLETGFFLRHQAAAKTMIIVIQKGMGLD